MGEKIAQMESEIDGKKWVLVGHGDFYGGVTEPNPLEPGTYMPLSKKDLGRFKPETVFLGHIHKPHNPAENVHYVGSPCGLDISETGRRKFLVYDTADGSIDPRIIETDVLYFNESFLIVPRDNEVEMLNKEIARRIESWGIDPSDHSKVRVRVEAKGYATDRNAVLKELELGFGEFKYFKDEVPRIEQLLASSDDQLQAIADRTMMLINELDWSFGGDEPTREQVETAALSVIYEN
jgi:DNA repair exonuclease SbcCD nuclease subunit